MAAVSVVYCNVEMNSDDLLVFPWDQRGLLLLGVPNLLVGNVYHVKNEGCILEVFIMRLFNLTVYVFRI